MDGERGWRASLSRAHWQLELAGKVERLIERNFQVVEHGDPNGMSPRQSLVEKQLVQCTERQQECMGP